MATLGRPPACFAMMGRTLPAARSHLPPRQDQGQQSPPDVQEQAPEPPDDVLARVQVTLDVVSEPKVQALAETFGVPASANRNTTSAAPFSSMETLGDLDGDKIPEVALKWFLQDSSEEEPADAPAPHPSWRFFLLAWNGTKWQASPLGAPAEDLKLEVVGLGKATVRGIAVIAKDGEDAVPYPAVYQVENHTARLLWDGRADESRYEGYAHGRVEFHDVAGVTEMLAAGRADPGLLVFPKDGRRGFEIRSTYRWDGQAYVPVKTEYTPSPDYTLYRFIAALHLHDFRGAYALIDPPKFLNMDSPTLDKFRELVEGSWPEFLDDQVFEALDAVPDSPDPFAFMLAGTDKKFIYRPTFGAGAKSLLTDLKRQEEK